MRQIDHETQQQEERGQQEQFALHCDQVAVADVGDQHGAKTRQGEQVFHHHHAGDHLREGQADHRHQLRSGQTQRHAQYRLFAGHAAGHGHVHRLR